MLQGTCRWWKVKVSAAGTSRWWRVKVDAAGHLQVMEDKATEHPHIHIIEGGGGQVRQSLYTVILRVYVLVPCLLSQILFLYNNLNLYIYIYNVYVITNKYRSKFNLNSLSYGLLP